MNYKNKFFTIPDEETVMQKAKMTPNYMHPNESPWAQVWEGALDDDECDWIIHEGMKSAPYTFGPCKAITRELSRPVGLELRPIIHFVEVSNGKWWKYDIDAIPAAWLQTYSPGGEYSLHTDATLGQVRKLTCIVLLSKEDEYDGGTLCVVPYPHTFTIPRTRGTLVVFPSNLLHSVSPVTRGIRQTINMGFWGPAFV